MMSFVIIVRKDLLPSQWQNWYLMLLWGQLIVKQSLLFIDRLLSLVLFSILTTVFCVYGVVLENCLQCMKIHFDGEKFCTVGIRYWIDCCNLSWDALFCRSSLCPLSLLFWILSVEALNFSKCSHLMTAEDFSHLPVTLNCCKEHSSSLKCLAIN